MVGVKIWTDDEIHFVIKVSEITKPNTSSTQKNPKPIRYFTDKEIANLCKQNVPNKRHSPDAQGVKYIRGTKKAEVLSPRAPKPSQPVREAIDQLRHQCNISSQHQDSMSGNMFTTPPNTYRGKLLQVQGMGTFAGPAPPRGPSGLEDLNSFVPRTMDFHNGNRVGQIVPQQFQVEGRGFHGPRNMFQQHGDTAMLDCSSQQQHGRAQRGTTLPTNVPYGSFAGMHPQLEQTMNYGQQMGTAMQNGNGISLIPQQMYPSTMYQPQGNQMGSGASMFEPQMQAYIYGVAAQPPYQSTCGVSAQQTYPSNYGVPVQPPYPPDLRGYTPGLQNPGGNEIMIPPGPTDVGRFTSPYCMPSYGQSNGGIMSHGEQYHGKDQLLAQQADVQFRGGPGVTLEAMPDSQFKPPTSHGLQQATMNKPGSANDPAKYFGNPEMSNNFGKPGGAAAQVKAIRPQPQPSARDKKRHKGNADDAGLSDMYPDEDGERKHKRNNSGDGGFELLNHSDHNKPSDRISTAHTLGGLHNASLAAETPISPVSQVSPVPPVPPVPPVTPVAPLDSLNAAPVPAPLAAPDIHIPAQLGMDIGIVHREVDVFTQDPFQDQIQGRFQQEATPPESPDSREYASLAMDDFQDLSESAFNDLLDLHFS